MASRGVKSLRRRFDFFTKERVASVDDAKKVDIEEIKLFSSDFKPICCSSGCGRLIFGDEGGYIRVASQNFQISQFKSHSHRIMMLEAIKGSDYLVVLGRQEITPNPCPQCIIKIWSLSSVDAFGQPKCIIRFPIFSDKHKDRPVKSLAASKDCTHIAVGLGDGDVLTFDLFKNKRAPERRLLAKMEAVVTGLHFIHDETGVCLFVVTVNEVRTYFYNQARRMIKLDDRGALEQCSILNADGQLVVAREKAIYFYTTDEPRGFDIFHDEKKMLRTFKNYLIVVTSINIGETNHASLNRCSLTVYDRKNKLIAFKRAFDDVIDIVYEWGKLYVVTRKSVECLVEKNLDEKLNTLFNKNLYQKALDMLLMEDPCSPKVPEYYKRYGDVLYEKHDFDGAIDQYCLTINSSNLVEPSYVIRRFLDAQRIHHLVKYLEALHDAKAASPDHTTLLLNCYTKLKNLSKLDAFIKKDDLEDSKQEERFDVATAIRVCRQAGLHDHALYLSKKHNYHNIHLQILLENAADAREMKDAKSYYSDAIKYIGRLEFFEAEAVMKTHGQVLLDHVREPTIKMLESLCTNYRPEVKSNNTDDYKSSRPEKKEKILRSKPEDFIHVFVKDSRSLESFLEFCVNESTKCDMVVYNTLLECYLRRWKKWLTRDNLAEERKKLHQLIMKLLSHSRAQGRDEMLYDVDHALVLCKMYMFEDGVIRLYEKKDLYINIVEHYMELNEHQKILDTCRKWTKQCQRLWVRALAYFAGKNNCEKEIKEVLTMIPGLLEPLMVCQILARNESISLSVCRDYITQYLQDQQERIHRDLGSISKLKEGITKMRTQIDELTHVATIFQGTQCHSCSNPLELPVVHFLCSHSYHKDCLVDNTNTCPKCNPEYQNVLTKQENMQKKKKKNDTFFEELKMSDDSFKVLAEYISFGVLGGPSLRSGKASL